ncbi:hypothetical protein SLEP1_g48721 [Rubroshorea leprosula]|uniref:Uncharacterized protein n=1 Tax=Rubroshorea leprosula TaxID=152421 RepID=A0AAV5LXF0_9ROSI|nr:hypothetical protein SLEP1_g48721 [Rubroshorea leprosula]
MLGSWNPDLGSEKNPAAGFREAPSCWVPRSTQLLGSAKHPAAGFREAPSYSVPRKTQLLGSQNPDLGSATQNPVSGFLACWVQGTLLGSQNLIFGFLACWVTGFK